MSDKHATLENRDGFQSKWGFILACIGSAVGMGNIWRFPIMVQQFGGMTFLIPYFLFVLLIGSTGIIEEFALGRWAQGGPVISFGKATEERTGNKRLGEAIGALPIVGSMMLAIGYTVVMSWIFKYCWMGISGSLYAMGTDMATIGGTFGGTAPEAETLGEALSMMFGNGIFGIGNGVWLIVGLVASLAIMAFGVGNGIEKANKVMMPALFFLFVILGIYICTLPGASEGYKYIFTLKPEGLLNPQVWVFAFGQAFFSLSVAGNGSVIYGSYLPKDEDLPSSARNVALFDTIAALLAAIVIIPAMAVILGDGIVGMRWEAPYSILENVTEDSSLIPFSEVEKIFEKMIALKYANTQSIITIENICFGYARVAEQNRSGSALMVPAWDFFGTISDFNGISRSDYGTSLITINAIDGSIIDRGLGY